MEALNSTADPAGAPSAARAYLYRFILPTFEGPLDLLLHLIRVNEIDIKDIPIVEIARQYDQMIELMQEMNLDIAGDFLVMAATLVYIKSKMLLPADQERLAEGLEEDPRADLARALIEHERFKQAAAQLAEQEQLAALVFTRPRDPSADEDGYLDVNLSNLLVALRQAIESAGRRQALQFRPQELPITEMIDRILSRLAHENFVSFSSLVREDEWSVRAFRIAAFLAVLELVRQGKVRAYQRRLFDEIRLRAGGPA